jgi:hypothetical protein
VIEGAAVMPNKDNATVVENVALISVRVPVLPAFEAKLESEDPPPDKSRGTPKRVTRVPLLPKPTVPTVPAKARAGIIVVSRRGPPLANCTIAPNPGVPGNPGKPIPPGGPIIDVVRFLKKCQKGHYFGLLTWWS